jgi:hypothetical protein
MKEEEKKKDYRIMPSLQNGTLEEWEAFNPYSMCSGYAKQTWIHKLSSSKRKYQEATKDKPK